MLDTKMNPTQNHLICIKKLGGKNELDIPNFNGVAMKTWVSVIIF